MAMARQRRSFTPEYKDQVARMVVEESRAIPSTAREIGVNEQTLRNWVNAYRQGPAGEEPPLKISEGGGRRGGHPRWGAAADDFRAGAAAGAGKGEPGAEAGA